MNIIEFIEKYPTEESCKSDFKIQREFEGVKCKNCGSGKVTIGLSPNGNGNARSALLGLP